MKKLGEFYSQSERAGDARESWQAALAEFDRCLEIAPENQEARHQKESLMKLLQGLAQ